MQIASGVCCCHKRHNLRCLCSTSPSGGNQVDGLPPASSGAKHSLCSLGLGRPSAENSHFGIWAKVNSIRRRNFSCMEEIRRQAKKQF